MEARNGLAAALSWEGKLDDALALYDESLAIEPGNGDALSGRARVLYWQGRREEARTALDKALAAHPGDREALKLDAAMRDGSLPTLSASAGVAHDSDHNAVNLQRAAYSFIPTASTTSEISYDRYDASQPGSPDGRIETVKAAGSLRLGGDLSVSGSLGLEQDTRGASSTTRLRLAGSAGADFRVDDRLSFSGSLESVGFAATARSINRDVAVTALTLTAAYLPAPRVSTRLSLQRASFTEDPDASSNGLYHGNQRDLQSAYVRWAVPSPRPKIGLSFLERYYTYARATNDGYFAPQAYVAGVAGIDLSDRISKRVGWSADGSLGLQRVRPFGTDPADTNSVKGYHVAISYDFDRGVTLEGYAGRTNLALQLGTGFRSTEAGIRLRWRMGSAAAPRTGGTP
jgi:tetratricopeptide (TPR) repeat protein